MSGDGQAVIEQIYSMGVAPGTEAAAAGAWARAGSGGPVPPTIVGTFDGIGFGGLERPEEVVAEWSPDDLPGLGEPAGVWIDRVQGIGLTGTGTTLVEEGLVTLAGTSVARGVRLLPADCALTSVGGDLISERGGIVAVIHVMDVDAVGDVISTKPALGGAGSDYLEVTAPGATPNWATLGVDKGTIGDGGPTFIQIDVTASQVAALFARGTPVADGGIASAIEAGLPEFRAGLRFGNNLAASADFRLFGAAVYHGDADAGALVLRYMQSRYNINVAA
jgi:hypothetical protein